MKKKFNCSFSIFIPFFILVLILSSCTTNNWPQFRGPDFNMVLTGKSLPMEWGDSLNVKWTQNIEGESWSSPVIYGDKVFYTSAVLVKKAPVEVVENQPEQVAPVQPQVNGETPPPPRPMEDLSYLKNVYRWQITCVDLKTGNELWKKVSYEGTPKVKKHAASNYSCETPVTDGKRIYVYYGMVGVYCYDLNGNLLWTKDLGAYETQNGWGTGSSPVVYNDVLYVQVDNEISSFIVALNATDGEEKWKKSRDEKTTYGTPVIWKNSVRTELVSMGLTVRSYNPESGELFWELKIGKGSVIPSPVFDSERIYFGNVGDQDTLGILYAVKAGVDGDLTPVKGEPTSSGVVWSNTEAGMANPSPLLYEGLLYIIASRGGEINCVDALTGAQVYKEKVDKVGACWASPWAYNNQIYFYDEKGVTQVIKAGKDFEVISKNTLDDKFWTSIAATKDAYIFKGVKKLYCVGK